MLSRDSPQRNAVTKSTRAASLRSTAIVTTLALALVSLAWETEASDQPKLPLPKPRPIARNVVPKSTDKSADKTAAKTIDNSAEKTSARNSAKTAAAIAAVATGLAPPAPAIAP